MTLPKSAAYSSAVPQNPFNDFINPGGFDDNNNPYVNFESLTPSADPSKRLFCGFQLGGVYNGTGLGAGFTGCGLSAIFEAARTLNLLGTDACPYDKTGFIFYNSYIVASPQALIRVLNQIHNNINEYLYFYDPSGGAYYGTGAIPTRTFNFFNNYLFPGTYDKTAYLNNGDVTGGGIINCFVIKNSTSGKYELSRAGYEFYTLLNYLSYGGVAMVNPIGWDKLVTMVDNRITSDTLQTLGNYSDYVTFDAFATLEMSSFLDGQGITSPTGDYQAVYAGATYFYAAGNTLNYTQGVGATMLNGNYGNIITRNNIFNSILDTSGPRYNATSKAVIIHAGLSGAAVSVAQDTITGDYTDVYRYSGLDGRQSYYQNLLSTSGLTAYTLQTDPYLNRVMCVMGKKTKKIYSANFGDPNDNYYLTITLPLVSDVAGALHLAKQAGALNGPITGPVSGKLLNFDTVSPNIPSTSANATTLKTRRVNFYSSSQSGSFLASDLVGATGSYTANNRYGLSSLNRTIKTKVTDILNTLISNPATSYNNATTRQAAVTQTSAYLDTLKGTYFISDGTVTAAPNGYTVQCDTNNGNVDNTSTLYVTITYYPKAPITTTGTSNLTGVVVTVSAIGAV